MEFFLLNSSVTIAAACILMTFVLLQLSIDIFDGYRSRKLYKHMLEFAKKRATRDFTVLLEADDNVMAVLSAVDSLYRQKYPKLQVIVVVQSGKNEVRTGLEKYRRKNKISGLRIIQKHADYNPRGVLRRYGKGVFCMVLDVHQRLFADFFTMISAEFLGLKDVAVVPSRHLKLNKTISSALFINDNILAQIRVKFRGVNVDLQHLQKGVVYSRRAVLSNSSKRITVRANVSQNAAIIEPAPIRGMRKYFRHATNSAALAFKKVSGVSIFLLVIAALVALSIFAGVQNMLVLVSFIGVTYWLTGIMMQSRLRGYSLMNRSDLALVEPLNFVIAIIVCVAGFLKMVWSLFTGRKLS